jgi:formate-dependent nitrite reductase membrane component NrfD
MALRQWMVTHEWMIKPTRQTEWIDRRGLVFLAAEVFTALGAGLYLVSLGFNNWWGMLVSWIIVMFLKIPLHIIYFGKPLRFWRTIIPFTKAWNTSWLARGVNFNILFGMVVFVQLVVAFIANTFFPGTIWGTASFVLGVLGGISALLVGLYGGFMMSYCRSVPFWNTSLLPLILLFASIADGFALFMAVGLAGAQVNMVAAEAGTRWILIINALMTIAYLWNATYTSKTSKYSAFLLLKGYLAPTFWIGVAGFAIAIPLVISVSSLFAGEAAPVVLIIAVVLHTLGAVALKYTVLKAGVHNPIVPATTSSFH